MIDNFFTRMDTMLANILEIKKSYPDEASILIISYIDSLSKYSSSIMKEFPKKNENKKKFLRFVGDYSNAHNYLDCVMMHRIYNLRSRHAGCKMIYEEYKDIFDQFIIVVKKEGQCGITGFLKRNDIEKIKGIEKYFGMNYDPKIKQSDIYFSGYFYELRSMCVHEHENRFHNDFDKVPYYLYVPCDGGNDFVSVEIPFAFLNNILVDCYEKVKKEFNTRMKNSEIFNIMFDGADIVSASEREGA